VLPSLGAGKVWSVPGGIVGSMIAVSKPVEVQLAQGGVSMPCVFAAPSNDGFAMQSPPDPSGAPPSGLLLSEALPSGTPPSGHEGTSTVTPACAVSAGWPSSPPPALSLTLTE
jgi:hypothetical protein